MLNRSVMAAEANHRTKLESPKQINCFPLWLLFHFCVVFINNPLID